MKTAPLAASLLVLALASPVRAELPDYLLDKDYQNCVGADTSDRQRIAYCECVRSGMQDWDMTTYVQAATQMAAAAASNPNAQPTGMIQTLAQGCLAKVMH